VIPKTMKAVLTRGHGGLEMLDYTEVPTPVPRGGEVLIEVTACGLNNTDIWSRMGAYGTDRDPKAVTGPDRTPGKFPVIQGADVVGRIAAVGAGVPAHRVGERVICNMATYTDWPAGTVVGASFGFGRAGGYAQYTTTVSESAYAIDCALSDAELATFPCAYITSENMLDAAGVKAGDTVLITGASGGVGSALIQLARARGARSVAITSTAKRAKVATLEPHALVCRDAGDIVEQVRAAIGQSHVDAVADVVAGSLVRDLLALLREQGHYVTAGAIGDAVVEVDWRTIYLKNLTLHGVSLGTRQQFERVLDYIRAGKIRPLLAATYPLSEIRRAQSDFMAKGFFGNLVVLPGA